MFSYKYFVIWSCIIYFFVLSKYFWRFKVLSTENIWNKSLIIMMRLNWTTPKFNRFTAFSFMRHDWVQWSLSRTLMWTKNFVAVFMLLCTVELRSGHRPSPPSLYWIVRLFHFISAQTFLLSLFTPRDHQQLPWCGWSWSGRGQSPPSLVPCLRLRRCGCGGGAGAGTVERLPDQLRHGRADTRQGHHGSGMMGACWAERSSSSNLSSHEEPLGTLPGGLLEDGLLTVPLAGTHPRHLLPLSVC